MASLRKKIQEQLVAVLRGITPANGYHNTVAAVTKSFKSIEQLAAFPHLAVLEGEQTLRPVSEEETLYEATASFAIVGCVKADNDGGCDGALSDACDSLIEDIKESLLANAPSIVGSVDAGELRLVSDEPMVDDANNSGYVIVVLTISYIHGVDV